MHVLWLLFALLAKSMASGKLTCSTTTTSNGTVYKISGFGKSHCVAQWIDIDNRILANSDGKNDSLVVAFNLTTLHTHYCYNKVMYVLDCYPSTEPIEVTCVANCSESAAKTGDGENITLHIGDVIVPSINHTEQLPKVAGTSNHSLIPVICIITFVILLVVSLVGICYWRRQRRNQSGL